MSERPTFPRIVPPTEVAPLPPVVEGAEKAVNHVAVELLRLHAENHNLRTRLQVAYLAPGAAMSSAEWITTGDRERPTLWHYLSDAFVEWAGITDGERREFVRRIESIISALATGERRFRLECYRCTLDRVLCQCCPQHRMDAEPPVFDCERCARDARGDA